MFKKIFSVLMALCCFSAFAVAPSAADLKRAMDEFNYSIAVEWNQKDLNFVDAKREELKQKYESLRNAGLADSEILNYIESTLKKPSSLSQLNLVRNQYKLGLLNSSDFADQVANILKQDASTGAAWNGDAVGLSVLAVFGVGIIAFFILSITTAKPNDPNAPTGFYCHEKTCQWDFVGQYSCTEGTGPSCP